jgi:hypothetical protein
MPWLAYLPRVSQLSRCVSENYIKRLTIRSYLTAIMARTSQIRGRARMKQVNKPPIHRQLVTATDPTSGSTLYHYPGLGLPIRYNEQDNYGFYPIGAHGSNAGSESLPLFVRELAMMDIMEKLTDKPDWHKKVFDEEIVAKWRTEALAIPNLELYKLATSGKGQSWNNEEDGQVVLSDDEIKMIPEGIMNGTAFQCVSIFS